MKTNKNRRFLWLLLLLILPVAWWLVGGLKVTAFDAVPKDTAVILPLKTMPPDSVIQSVFPFHFFLQRPDLQKDLQLLGDWWKRQGGKLKSGLLCLEPVSADRFGYLLIAESDRAGEVFENTLSENANWRQTVFQDRTIYSISGDQGFAFTLHRDLLLVAPMPLMVEDGIRAINDGGGIDIQKLPKDARLYMSTSGTASQLGRYFRGSEPIPFPGRGAGAWAFDWQNDSLGLNMTGLASLTSGSFQASSFGDLRAILPGDAGGIFAFKQSPNRMEGAPPFRDFVRPWMEGTQAYVFPGHLPKATLLFLKSTDVELAKNSLSEMEDQLGILQEYAYQTFTIRQVLAEQFLPHPMRNPFYVAVGNFLVFSDSQQALEVYLDQYLTAQTLENQADFQRLEPRLPQRMLGFFLAESAGLSTRIGAVLQPDLGFPVWEGMPANWIVGSLEEKGGMLRLQATYLQEKGRSKGVTVAWKAELEEAAITPPAVFAGDGQETAILIQDKNLELYCLNKAGQIRWQRRVNNRITSEIQELDLYQNGERQWVFSTPYQIYVIDEEGQPVGSFPITLPDVASNGVRLVDFNGHGDYAFFIACVNRQAFGYDKIGNPLPGWNPQDTVGQVIFPIEHFQSGNKDYISLLNQEGWLHTYRRDGLPRFAPIRMEGVFVDGIAYQEHPSATRMVVCNVAGRAKVINSLGDHFMLNLTAGTNKLVEFTFADVWGDDRNDYAVLSGQDLAVYGYQGNSFKKRFGHQFPHTQDELFSVRLPGNGRSQIGTFSLGRKQVSLLQEDGRLYPGFPLAASEAFAAGDVLETGQAAVVTVLGETVICYLVR